MSNDKGKKPAETKEPRRALGRGLDALLPVTQIAAAAAARAESPYQMVGIERVHPRRDQPRKRFDEPALEELARSIEEQGLIQPLVVRRSDEEEGYEIIAGERRWRAAQRAGLREVPVVIKDVDPESAFELALVENVQRMDLDPVETATAYRRLMDEHGYTQDVLSRRIGKDRSTIANTLRLLQLPDEVQGRVVARELSEGHARAILSLKDPGEITKLARVAAEKGWSVRQTEQFARRKLEGPKPPATPDPAKEPAPASTANVRDLEKKLESALGMPVAIRTDGAMSSGTVEIGFDNLDQLDRFLRRVLGE